MSTRSPQRNSRTRLEIAAEAARIMATEGQRSFLAAKQKAARRLGTPARNGLPSNREIEQALRDWQQLYGGSEHVQTLLELRQTALAAMRFFKTFRPRLVGPVLEGTADEHSRICLHLFADDPDAIIHFLMENGLPFSQESRRIRWHDGSIRDLELMVIEADGQTIELAQLIGPDSRQPLPSPVDGRPQRRASQAELEALIDDSATMNSDDPENF